VEFIDASRKNNKFTPADTQLWEEINQGTGLKEYVAWGNT
jgi:hypothetical protein